MSINLLDLASEHFTLETLHTLAGKFGIQPDDAPGVIGRVFPSLLALVGERAASEDGAETVFQAVKDADDSLLNDLTSAFSGDTTALQAGGAGVLNTLFGSQLPSLAQNVGVLSGTSGEKVEGLFGMLTPVLSGVLGKLVRSSQLQPSGLQSILQGQGENISVILGNGFMDKLLPPADRTALNALSLAAVAPEGVAIPEALPQEIPALEYAALAEVPVESAPVSAPPEQEIPTLSPSEPLAEEKEGSGLIGLILKLGPILMGVIILLLLLRGCMKGDSEKAAIVAAPSEEISSVVEEVEPMPAVEEEPSPTEHVVTEPADIVQATPAAPQNEATEEEPESVILPVGIDEDASSPETPVEPAVTVSPAAPVEVAPAPVIEEPTPTPAPLDLESKIETLEEKLSQIATASPTEISDFYEKLAEEKTAQFMYRIKLGAGESGVPSAHQDALLKQIKAASPQSGFVTIGYADTTGNAETNKSLSLGRAEKVEAWINEKLGGDRETASFSMGETDRFSKTDYAENRVVEVWEIKQ